MVQLIRFIVATSLAWLTAVSFAFAQNPYSVAYTVNDAIISNYDISQRVSLLRVLGGSGDLRSQAIEELIDDRLKVDYAQLLGAVVDRHDVQAGIEAYAAQSGISADQWTARARAGGVAQETLEEFVAVSIMWRSVVQQRFRQLAAPTEAEINNETPTIKTQSVSTVRLAEIAIPFAERGQEGAMTLAARLSEELNAGGDFATAARRFSRSASAARGGDLGMVLTERMPPALASLIRSLQPGQVSAPIPVEGGVLLFKLVGYSSVSNSIPRQIFVSYATIPLPAGTDDVAARAIQESLNGCRNLPEGATRSARINVRSLNNDDGIALARLEPRQTAFVPTGTPRVLVLCERTAEMDDQVRNSVAGALLNQEMQAYSRGLLLELRRTSLIERK